MTTPASIHTSLGRPSYRLNSASSGAEKVLWYGRELLLRPIRPAAGARHGSFFAQLTSEDLRLRFFSSRREVPCAEIERQVHPDPATEVAFIMLAQLAGGPVHEPLEELATARAVTDDDNLEAEFGIAVRSDLKGQGLGRLLLAKLIESVRRRGTKRIACDVLRENAPMSALATRLGFRNEKRSSEHGSLRYVLDLQSVRGLSACRWTSTLPLTPCTY